MPKGAPDTEYLNAGSEEQEEKSELWNAAFHGRTEKVKRLLEDGADIEEKNWEDSATALHGAAERGKREIVQQLLDKGATIDATQVHGYTPLSLASKRGHMVPFPRRWGCSHLRFLSLRTCSVREKPRS